MATLFISDLHLEDSRPQISELLLRLLDGPAREAEALYILGDLFEFWIGPLIGGATENWFAYVLALLFLVFRPQGLFGEKIIERV